MWQVAAALGGVNALQGIGNYFLQKENLQWQKDAQRTTWEREDNAVLRRAQDLQNAGLSKTLAAGSAAQSSGPISTQAPQVDAVGKGIDAATAALALMRQKADIARTYAEIDNIKLQGQLAVAQAGGINQATKHAIDINPVQLAQAVKGLTTTDLDQANRSLDIDVKKLNIDKGQLELIKQEIDTNIAKKFALKQAEIDLLAKKLAVKNAEVQYQSAGHDLGIYQKLGLPTKEQLGTVIKGGVVTGNALGNLLAKIRNDVSEIDWQKLRSY